MSYDRYQSTTPSISIDNEIDRILTEKKQLKAYASYDDANHSTHIAEDDWTLLNCILRKKLGEKNVYSSLGVLILAESSYQLMQYIAQVYNTNKILDKSQIDNINSIQTVVGNNKEFARRLVQLLRSIPDNKLIIIPVNITSADAVNQYQSHIINMGFKMNEQNISIHLYDSYPLDENTRDAYTTIIGQVIKSLILVCNFIINGIKVDAQEAADCSLHAVFNAITNERAINTKKLSFEECTDLRKALDQTNQTRDITHIDTAVTRILLTRRLIQGSYTADTFFHPTFRTFGAEFSYKYC